MGSGDDTVAGDEVTRLRADNERLGEQLHRIVESLERRADIGVRVDLDAGPDEPTIVVTPLRALPPDGLAEVREVAERLVVVQRDMDRLRQQVEKLLWRMGDRHRG